jgi:putative membrane protein
MISNYGLATLNAVLNSTALLFMLLGFAAIKKKDIALHRRHMLTAFVLSLIFLASYGTRIVLYGDTKFLAEGPVRYVYFFILITHVVLAILIAPAVLYTVTLGLRGNVERHKRIAPKVLPVWGYVLATGVLVYLFLHHFPA